MAIEQAPAFQWYPKDCLTDPVVVKMSLEAEGAYRRLMDYCWLKGSLDYAMSDLAPLAKAKSEAHMAKLWSQMVHKFQAVEIEGVTRWVHPRLEEERQKQAESRERRRKAADERWSKAHAMQEQSICNADAMQCSPSSSPSPSSTPVSTVPRSALFDAFWSAYPKHVGKDAARKAFDKRKVDDALLALMLSAVAVQRRSAAWTKDGGQYVPNPATWLNQGRWQDDVFVDPATARKIGPDYADKVDWFAECKALHEGKCGNSMYHRHRMARDADEQASV